MSSIYSQNIWSCVDMYRHVSEFIVYNTISPRKVQLCNKYVWLNTLWSLVSFVPWESTDIHSSIKKRILCSVTNIQARFSSILKPNGWFTINKDMKANVFLWEGFKESFRGQRRSHKKSKNKMKRRTSWNQVYTGHDAKDHTYSKIGGL